MTLLDEHPYGGYDTEEAWAADDPPGYDRYWSHGRETPEDKHWKAGEAAGRLAAMDPAPPTPLYEAGALVYYRDDATYRSGEEVKYHWRRGERGIVAGECLWWPTMSAWRVPVSFEGVVGICHINEDLITDINPKEA